MLYQNSAAPNMNAAASNTIPMIRRTVMGCTLWPMGLKTMEAYAAGMPLSLRKRR
jgi:hypothetical protein